MLCRKVFVAVFSLFVGVSNTHAEAQYPMLSGGIGDEELEQLRNVEDRYSAKVMFVGENGMYLTDVHVSIRDSHGSEVEQLVTKGPVLLVDLPEGSYTVHAELDGYVREQAITVNANRAKKTVHIRFPIKDE